MAKDKNVIVTGAGQGMGRSIAAAFAAQGCGVLLSDVRAEAAEKAAESIRTASAGKVVATGGDVRKAIDVTSMLDLCIRELGGVDILVNNAGILFPTAVELSLIHI